MTRPEEEDLLDMVKRILFCVAFLVPFEVILLLLVVAVWRAQ